MFYARNMITSHIREIAEKFGIQNANQLRVALDVSPTLAARLWKGDFDMLGMVTINKLCRVLRCQPGKLLKYTNEHEE
jgi:DNA-binding Xre family transcriptional regulator